MFQYSYNLLNFYCFSTVWAKTFSWTEKIGFGILEQDVLFQHQNNNFKGSIYHFNKNWTLPTMNFTILTFTRKCGDAVLVSTKFQDSSATYR